jgi:hypothetical protein
MVLLRVKAIAEPVDYTSNCASPVLNLPDFLRD